MVDRSGHIELDHPVGSITVGHRHRRDLGDLTELVDSIRTMGMLQPITVSPDGLLICGARRLAAAKQLGLRRINVWVRAGISSPLQQLLAEQHDNTVRKAFSPSEAAGMYAELKSLLAEEAARRQEASQFGSDTDMQPGPADSAAPSDRTSRAQAARLVSGRRSYTRFEQVLELQRLTTDPETPETVRQAASTALADIDTDGKVNGHYQRVKAVQAAIAGERQQSDDVTSPAATSPGERHKPHVGDSGEPQDDTARETTQGRYRLRAFLLVLAELSGWTTRHDPTLIGPSLSDEQWSSFEDAVDATVAFTSAARAARQDVDAARTCAPS